jgi:uncharacterized C2H2 Zn-finger protein
MRIKMVGINPHATSSEQVSSNVQGDASARQHCLGHGRSVSSPLHLHANLTSTVRSLLPNTTSRIPRIWSTSAKMDDGGDDCDFCGQHFSTRGSRRRHQRTSKSCKELALTEEAWREAHRLSKLPYACPLCPARFSTSQHFRQHDLETHEGVLIHLTAPNAVPFPCMQCNKIFAGRNNYNRHVNSIHEKAKPFNTTGHSILKKPSFKHKPGSDATATSNVLDTPRSTPRPQAPKRKEHEVYGRQW